MFKLTVATAAVVLAVTISQGEADSTADVIKERLKEARAAAENATRSRDAFSAGDQNP